ncbi:MAG: NAD-dependent epimerase/dehydratase family protein, partial [Burkholderiales bacterium]|nr:NAD-dependent epimerase/dehydratase family protein [Burkholderiales bacterium]
MSKIQAYIRALEGPVLVMGASGFIGANLYKSIATVRDDVFAVVNQTKGWRLTEVNDEHIISVDLNDFAATKNLVNSVKPQTIFDCVAYGAYSFEEDSNLIYQTNFQAIVNLVSLLAGKPFAAYIHAGSSSEYGTNCAAPIEDSVCEPNSPYAVSKVAIAGYLQFMGKKREFPCANLRLYSVYGPLEDTSRLFPNLIRQAIDKKLPPFVDASTSRDFIYIDDVCNAFILAAAKMHPGLYGENFNIGTGVKTTIKKLSVVTKQVFDVDQEPKFDTMDGRNWDLEDWYANPAKANRMLDWHPNVDLERGLRKMALWVANLSGDDMIHSTKKYNSQRKRSISAIIACYKDEQAIPVMYQRLTDTFKKIGIDYEIIFVNDGSPDNSEQVIRDISSKDSRVIGITHSRNFGSQMAFRSGMELSSKEGVVLLDGDLQDPPELIQSFHAKWEEGFEVIYGRRVKRDMSWHWGVLYKLFYR